MNTVSQNNGELRELYRELILDHARNPRHFGKLDNATHCAEGINPLCGDKLRLYLRVNEDQSIDAAGFEGSGCAISVASASLLTEQIIGLPSSEATNYFNAVTQRLTSPGSRSAESSPLDLGKLKALDGVREYPSRIKCATLAWHAMDSALNNQSTPVSTE
jgi:nitrogen fixation NifU-like protein